MKKTISNIVGSILILPTALATILCCNFSGIAQAKSASAMFSKTESAMPSCHANPLHQSNSTKSNALCCHVQLQANLLTKFSLDTLPTVSNLFPTDLILTHSAILKNKFNLAFLDGPPVPGSVFETPRFIHFRNIRI